jgi:hypothetical protein
MNIYLVFLGAMAVAHAAKVVTVTNCADGQCSTGCQSQQFKEGECLTEENTGNTVELSCFSGPTFCNDLKVWNDPQCSDQSQMALASNVCNSCQANFSVSCGALHQALFVAVNCTDTACQNCGGAVIVPFGKCTQVSPLGWLTVTAVTSCVGVGFQTFYGSSNCQSANNYTAYYQSGKCFEGTKLTCSD